MKLKIMFAKKKSFLVIFLFIANYLFAQLPTNGLDVKHYTFFISLNDSNNIIRGKANITTGFTKNENEVVFDLVDKKKSGKGMAVISVDKNNSPIQFYQDSQHLVINDKMQVGNEATYNIVYEGIPADGLIIGNNKYGDRVFLATTGQTERIIGFPATTIFQTKQP
jgi:aminopeptidase N